MTSYVTPKKNAAFIIYAGLPSAVDNLTMKNTPTLAAGDFRVSIDGGALANLGTLPTNTPAASAMVKFSLSAAEMNGDNITVVCVDQTATKEWADVIFNIQTSARQIDDLAYPATSGRSMVVDAAGLVDATTVKLGPTGAATTQTANDLISSISATYDQAAFAATRSLDIQGRIPTLLVSGRIDASVGAMAANVLTAAAINADAITDAKVAADVTIASVTGSVGSVTGNVGGNVVGSVASVTAGVTLAASAVQAIWDALTSALTTVGSIGKLLVDNINATISSRASASNLATAQTSIDDLPTNAELSTALGTADDATLAAIAALNNLSQANIRTAVGLASANLDTQLAALPTASSILTTQMTEAYAADGVAPTLAQALFLIQQQLGDFAISGTTLTVKKLDGSTTAATFTLDSATSPTSVTRAT